MPQIALRDPKTGEVLFHLDGEYVRDDSGKVTGEPISLRDLKGDERLSALGAVFLRDRAGTEEGRQVLLDLGVSDVLTPATQADFGAAVDGCVADEIAPVREVKRTQGVWYVENAGDAIQTAAQPADSEGGGPVVMSTRWLNGGYMATTYGLAVKIPKFGAVNNADFDLRARSLRYLLSVWRLQREVRVATMLLASTSWAATNKVAATAKWNGGASPDPLADVFAALALSALPANAMVLSEDIARYFFQGSGATSVQVYVQSGGQLPRAIWGRAKYALGSTGATVTPAYIWSLGGAKPGNLVLIRSSPDPMMLQTAMTFRFVGNTPDGERSEGLLVRTFRDPSNQLDEYIAVVADDAEVMLCNASASGSSVAGTTGALITGVYA